MGFLQICAGVVLLQLSKSAKDVPDTAVLKGDLDQVRTVAEQEEPEYEPRADTIRGGASIIRSLSRTRTEKQVMEVKRIHEEQMQPIGENEPFEWDGLRRRRTVTDLNNPVFERTGTVIRHKVAHPPLGMSYFPEDESDNESDLHPGFFQRLRSRSRGKSINSNPPAGLSNLPRAQTDGSAEVDSEKSHTSHMNTDTSYKPHETTVQFAVPSPPAHGRQTSQSSSLAPPKPPPHTAKRQFSFQNVFSRNRSQSTGDGSGALRPTSRNSRKSSKDHSQQSTEEERLGLVKGDSTTLLPIQSQSSREVSPGPPGYSIDSSWRRTESPGASPSPSRPADAYGKGLRRVDTEASEAYNEKDDEKGAFI